MIPMQENSSFAEDTCDVVHHVTHCGEVSLTTRTRRRLRTHARACALLTGRRDGGGVRRALGAPDVRDNLSDVLDELLDLEPSNGALDAATETQQESVAMMLCSTETTGGSGKDKTPTP